jgi:hypothetical protein
VAQGQRCTARYAPAERLDELVWADLCALLADPAQVAGALERAQGGAWLPQELQARQTTIRQALGQLERQRQRLLDAYLAEWSSWRSWNASGKRWTAAGPRCWPSSDSWTPSPSSGWSVEIRYVLPTSPDGPHPPYCQLRKDHLHRPAHPRDADQFGQRRARRGEAGVERQLPVPKPSTHQQPEPAARPAGSDQGDLAQS